MRDYRAPPWLLGGHSQTIWPALFSRRFDGPAPVYRRARWDTPDGDFVDVDWLDDPGATAAESAAVRPLLVMFHGLEGSSSSHYSQSFADGARRRGWRYAVPHFRGCSGEINRAPRAYHSGDFEEIGWILARLRREHAGPVVAVGVSLGGNALLRWAEEAGESAADCVHAVCAICSPLDLAAGGHAIGVGFNRQVYTRMFLRTMKAKAMRKWMQHPGLFDRERLARAATLYEFDNLFTAPLHGFRDTQDYWSRASAKPHLRRVRIPALLLNARNDPFVPYRSLPGPHEVSDRVTLWQPEHGGHVGFPGGRWPGHVLTLQDEVIGWLSARI